MIIHTLKCRLYLLQQIEKSKINYVHKDISFRMYMRNYKFKKE